MNTMKLMVLADNNTFIEQYYYGESAVGYYLVSEDQRILFDTGYFDIVLKMQKNWESIQAG